MNEWLSYRLSDFVMFSARVYERQIELYNREFAGLQILALCLAVTMIWICLRRPTLANRIVPVILGLGWLWVAWSFLWRRYAEINLLAEYAAIAFALEGAAFLVLALRKRGVAVQLPSASMSSLALAVIALPLFFYPLIAPLTGSPIAAAEFFLMTPDPTALGTLAILAFSGTRLRWLLMIAPTLWCALSAAMLWTLDLPSSRVLAAALPVVLILAVVRGLRRTSAASSP
ncbi:hypothetical protein K1W69_25975 [Hoeflea sp. WL0058]|uniref:MFS transporter permease n=1 Tax=Flavimaribacter sediminis TaxID=2865987 RepID=A0AAE2ZVU5_9HYPH|nr:DUF6064 family protein [Flavimaribacter sediminis]MBW8640667.1 hypothetical protein [Flavimaribacter sediminis]